MDLVLKSLIGENVTTGPLIYECMERVLKGNIKAEFPQQADSVGSCIVTNLTMLMATMTVHIFSTFAYCDQKQI